MPTGEHAAFVPSPADRPATAPVPASSGATHLARHATVAGATMLVVSIAMELLRVGLPMKTPDDLTTLEARAAQLIASRKWFASPYAYFGTVALAAGLTVVCPKLPPRYQLVCEVVHEVAHTLVAAQGPASLATSSATADAGR